ncbi:hypothetical protein [Photobacterium minamisatsumaniensis]|uniref:hypothetical protein n=1 Tax=Photobacterium minamisatsumaniensis TaxID=2910233 RepID=UPI003D0F3F50
MKKTVLALACAGLFGGAVSSTASAVTLYQSNDGDYVQMNGRVEVGGWFGKRRNDNGEKWTWYQGYVDDTFGDLAFKARTGDIYGVFDFDFERTPWTVDNEFQIVLDKAYVGWEFLDGHFVELGRNDTAYDDFDSHGDFSINEAVEVKEAGDQDNTVKYHGQINHWAMGVSYSLTGWDEHLTDSREGAVLNGYLGYFADSWTLLAGAETVKEHGEIYSLHGTYHLGQWDFGGLISYADRNEVNGYVSKDNTIGVASAAYQLTRQIQLVATYSNINYKEEYQYYSEEQLSDDWFTAGVNFQYRPNVRLAGEVVTGGEQGTFAYSKVYFRF